MESNGDRQRPSLDSEALGRESRYADELYTKLDMSFDHQDADEDLFSLGSVDVLTVKSVEKFIRVLETNDVVLQQQQPFPLTHTRREMLSSVDRYINALPTSKVTSSADDDDDDDNSTLPGTVVLEQEHPDMLQSISNYIASYTLEHKAGHTMDNFDNRGYRVGYSLENATANDSDGDENDSDISLQQAEHHNTGNTIVEITESMEDAPHSTASSVADSDDSTTHISPETLSQIGAFIDRVVMRNTKDLPSKVQHFVTDDENRGLSCDSNMAENGIPWQFSDDHTRSAVNDNPDLVASVNAYVHKLDETGMQSTVHCDKLESDHTEAVVVDEGIDDEAPIDIISSRNSGGMETMNFIEHGSVPSHLVHQRFYTRHPSKNSSSDPPAHLLSVRSDDSTESSPSLRRDPELSKGPVFDKTGDKARSDNDESNTRGNHSRLDRDPELLKGLISDTTGEHVRFAVGGNNSRENSSRPRRDPELSKGPVLDTCDEQNRSDNDESKAKENSSGSSVDAEITKGPVVATTRAQVRPRSRMGGPEIMRSTSSRIEKNRTASSNEDNGGQSSDNDYFHCNSRKENEDFTLDVAKRHPPSPEKKNHRQGNQTTMIDEENVPSAIRHGQADQICDVSNGTANKTVTPTHDSEQSIISIRAEESFQRNIQDLTIMVTGIRSPSANDETIVKKFAYFCYPFVEAKEPSAVFVSKMMCKAGELGLPLDAADRFLSLAQAVLDGRCNNLEIEAAPSDEVSSPRFSPASLVSHDSQGFEAFISSFVEAGAKDPQFKLPIEGKEANAASDDDKAYVDILVSSGNGGDDVADAIEVDLLCGALASNYQRYGYGHWQTFAAKLSMTSSGDDLDDMSSSSSDLIDKPPSRILSEPRDSPTEASLGQQGAENVTTVPNFSRADLTKPKQLMEVVGKSVSGETNDTFNRHIMKFWKEQQTVRKMRFGYPIKTIRTLAESHSLDENDTVSFLSASHASSYDVIEDLWIVRRSMAMYGKTSKMRWNKSRKLAVAHVQPPKPINAVHATARFFHCGSFLKRSKVDLMTNVWRETYADRTAAHSGYLDVHLNSLYAASSCVGARDYSDSVPWESRPVKQRFLHEQSVSFCKNWFGMLVPKKRNRIVDQPVCRPDSFPMPVSGEWTQEWYRKKSLQPVQSNLSGSAGPVALDPVDFFPEEELDDESFFDKAPQCGRIRNMHLKIGEKITLVTPDLTSSLKRSRWRKKYFPRGTFPYK